MTSPRRIALDVLVRVEQGGAFANVALDAALRTAGAIEQRDRALATELVYGTLRRAPGLDAILGQLSSRPIDSLDPKVRAALRLGAYQLRHLRIPDHAAVGEAVELCREVGETRAAGFVNAVLRSLTRADKDSFAPPFEVDPRQHLLVEEGLPGWLFDLWREALPALEVRELARAIDAPARMSFRAPDAAARDAAIERLAKAGIEATPATRSPVGLVIEGGATAEAVLAAAPTLQAQDEGAQLVTRFALAPGAEPLAPKQVLDPCAAPGGKACHLAQALPEAHVVATDLHKRRAARIAEEAARLGLGDRIETHPADATKPLPFADEESFDLVLLDAPCTGLGTLARHPEIKLRRSPDDIARLADLQARLLDRAARYVRPGGRLVYAVCTWTPDEAERQVARFLETHPGFAPDPPSPGDPALEGLVDETGALHTWPHRHGTDGFFAVRLRRDGRRP